MSNDQVASTRGQVAVGGGIADDEARPTPIAVGIVVFEVLVRMALGGVLRSASDITVVGEATDHIGAALLARQNNPRVLVIDADLPGADLAMIRMIQRHSPDTRIVLLGQPRGELVLPALQTGVVGFLSGDSEPDVLLNMVRLAAADVAVLPRAILPNLAHGLIGRVEHQDRARRRIRTLAAREHEVLGHLAAGLGNAEIARVMHVSQGTVKATISRVFAKLRCTNRVQVALLARDAGLATPEALPDESGEAP